MDKKILAVLEIADHEVRLVIGQFYNSRLNILKIERVNCIGVVAYKVIDKENLVSCIKKATDNVSKNLDVIVDKVILLIPNEGMHYESITVSKELYKPIERNDIVGFLNSIQDKNYENKILVNKLVDKYYINNIPTRKLPINESVSKLEIVTDLYYADKNAVFEYVMAVEESGLQVIDIVFDDLAFAKEASLYEGSLNKTIILFKYGATKSRLSIFYQGSLKQSLIIDEGIDDFAQDLERTYNIPNKVARTIINDYLTLKPNENEDKPIFVWSTKNKVHSLTQKELNDIFIPKIEKFIKDMLVICEPALELGECQIVVSGEGSSIIGIADYIENKAKVETKVYIPFTYGCRDVILTAALGGFYYYKDQSMLYNNKVDCVRIEQTSDILNPVNVSEETITNKIKKIFKQ